MASGMWQVCGMWHAAATGQTEESAVELRMGFWLCKQSGGKLSAASEASEASKANGPADVVAGI